MTKINRNPAAAAQSSYDVIIIGGGIYGVMLSLEACRRNLRSLLIEKADFGGATSYNSLRIVHGGFRYLQNLDLERFYESVGERKWFLKTFPELVKPLSCLMPLYNKGIRRPPILYTALKLNDALSINRNQGIRPDRHLAPGEVIKSEQVKTHFPTVDTQGLTGGAIWHDACMPDSQRLVIGILRWACSLGATALNYVEAKEILKVNQTVSGVLAEDKITGETQEFRAKIVVNAAGPWCRELAAKFDQDVPNLFYKSIAWNILFDRETLSDFALAVEPKKPKAQTYFLHPWKGRLLAGTIHNPWFKEIQPNPNPDPSEISEFIDNLNLAIPGLNLSKTEILRVFSGLLPGEKPNSNELAVREVILNHQTLNQGIKGLYSVSGVKFTTARLVAEKTIQQIFPNFPSVNQTETAPAEAQRPQGLYDYHWYPQPELSDWKTELQDIIENEAVQHLDDLILRRTSLGDNPKRALKIAPLVCQLFNWDEQKSKQEIQRLENFYQTCGLEELTIKN